MVHLFGSLLLWLLALAMLGAFPASEFARGMMTAPGKVSRGSCLVSLIGLALIVLLLRDAFGGAN